MPLFEFCIEIQDECLHAQAVLLVCVKLRCIIWQIQKVVLFSPIFAVQLLANYYNVWLLMSFIAATSTSCKRLLYHCFIVGFTLKLDHCCSSSHNDITCESFFYMCILYSFIHTEFIVYGHSENPIMSVCVYIVYNCVLLFHSSI